MLIFEAGIAAEMNSYRSLLFDEDDSVAESFEQMDLEIRDSDSELEAILDYYFVFPEKLSDSLEIKTLSVFKDPQVSVAIRSKALKNLALKCSTLSCNDSLKEEVTDLLPSLAVEKSVVEYWQYAVEKTASTSSIAKMVARSHDLYNAMNIDSSEDSRLDALKRFLKYSDDSSIYSSAINSLVAKSKAAYLTNDQLQFLVNRTYS